MWHFRTWFSRNGGVGWMVGLDDLQGLFQPTILWFYSVILRWCSVQAISAAILPLSTNCLRHNNIRAWKMPSWSKPMVHLVRCSVSHTAKGHTLQGEPRSLGNFCCFPVAFRNVRSGMLGDTSLPSFLYLLVELFLNLSSNFWTWWYHIPPLKAGWWLSFKKKEGMIKQGTCG